MCQLTASIAIFLVYTDANVFQDDVSPLCYCLVVIQQSNFFCIAWYAISFWRFRKIDRPAVTEGQRCGIWSTLCSCRQIPLIRPKCISYLVSISLIRSWLFFCTVVPLQEFPKYYRQDVNNRRLKMWHDSPIFLLPFHSPVPCKNFYRVLRVLIWLIPCLGMPLQHYQ